MLWRGELGTPDALIGALDGALLTCDAACPSGLRAVERVVKGGAGPSIPVVCLCCTGPVVR